MVCIHVFHSRETWNVTSQVNKDLVTSQVSRETQDQQPYEYRSVESHE